MKITVRLIVSLFITASLVAVLFTWLQVDAERTSMIGELATRSSILGEGLKETIEDYFRMNKEGNIISLVGRFEEQARFTEIAVFDSLCHELTNDSAHKSSKFVTTGEIRKLLARHGTMTRIESRDGQKTLLYATPLDVDGRTVGALLLSLDASSIDDRLASIWQTNFFHLLALIILIVVTTILVVRWSVTGPIARIALWMKGLRTGRISQPMNLPHGDLLSPLAREVTLLANGLAMARATAKEEARLRVEGESLWTAERLKEHVRMELNGKNLFVISNREPYMHVKQGGSIDWIMPAGGLVTAIDPIMRACGGLWIAHGNGNADRETVDEHNRLLVPPEEPSYTLRRVFLTKEEEEGYYYGFSNEGLWPLCHITHTRPDFTLNDWIAYQNVNEKFAQAVLEEIAPEESPLILIQDYHFSLLPLLIKSRRPDSRVAIFWHIPWPNPEVFGICPWKQELLLGLLGSDLIGFQTQFHCNNFLETVDQSLESKIQRDQFTVERHGQITSVRPFPISVAHPFETRPLADQPSPGALKESLLKKLGLTSTVIGVGVDRIDYTKGIVERFLAVRRFFEKHPEYVGRFSFIELGAPSRTHISRYHTLNSELEDLVEQINWSLQTKNWKPIVFLKAHHSHTVIGDYYRAADFCMVTSLHDGMNLVAKEFIATRNDNDGVLILSQFTGAARDLTDALIVNPYDIEEMADAIYRALSMSPVERLERMSEMRRIVKERNVYRWAANIVTTLCRIRTPKQQ